MVIDEEEKAHRRNIITWLKANFAFLLITLFLILAATISVTYAYKSAQAPKSEADKVTAMNAEVPERQPEAVSAETPPTGQTGTDQPPKSGGGETNSDAAPTENTLGASIDCLKIDKAETARLRTKLEQLKAPRSLQEILRFKSLATSYHEEYEQKLLVSGCKPTVAINDLLKSLSLVNLLLL